MAKELIEEIVKTIQAIRVFLITADEENHEYENLQEMYGAVSRIDLDGEGIENADDPHLEFCKILQRKTKQKSDPE